jgi:hypothetical protein
MRRRQRNANVIQLRSDDDPVSLAQHWEREVVTKLNADAEYYRQILEMRPSVDLVCQVWLRQRDDYELLMLGTADPELCERRKHALEQCEARMAALVREIEAWNAEVRARKANRCCEIWHSMPDRHQSRQPTTKHPTRRSRARVGDDNG